MISTEDKAQNLKDAMRAMGITTYSFAFRDPDNSAGFHTFHGDAPWNLGYLEVSKMAMLGFLLSGPGKAEEVEEYEQEVCLNCGAELGECKPSCPWYPKGQLHPTDGGE